MKLKHLRLFNESVIDPDLSDILNIAYDSGLFEVSTRHFGINRQKYWRIILKVVDCELDQVRDILKDITRRIYHLYGYIDVKIINPRFPYFSTTLVEGDSRREVIRSMHRSLVDILNLIGQSQFITFEDTEPGGNEMIFYIKDSVMNGQDIRLYESQEEDYNREIEDIFNIARDLGLAVQIPHNRAVKIMNRLDPNGYWMSDYLARDAQPAVSDRKFANISQEIYDRLDDLGVLSTENSKKSGLFAVSKTNFSDYFTYRYDTDIDWIKKIRPVRFQKKERLIPRLWGKSKWSIDNIKTISTTYHFNRNIDIWREIHNGEEIPF